MSKTKKLGRDDGRLSVEISQLEALIESKSKAKAKSNSELDRLLIEILILECRLKTNAYNYNVFSNVGGRLRDGGTWKHIESSSTDPQPTDGDWVNFQNAQKKIEDGQKEQGIELVQRVACF